MKTRLRFQTFTLAVSLALYGCSEDNKPQPKPKDEIFSIFTQPDLQAENKVRIVNSAQQPIPNAKVLAGMAMNVPVENNFLVTDANGEVQLPANFSPEWPLTVEAAGYIRQTVFGFKPEQQTIALNRRLASTKLELNGQVMGLPVKDFDDQIDFGLVMPALSRMDMLNFDLATVLSPYSDVITVVGQKLNIPTNVSLPSQKERYFLSITLDKPKYRLFFNEPGARRVYAAKGRFPFKTVVEELRNNKQFFELINYFSITGGSYRDVQMTNNSTTQDFPSNELSFTQKKNFKSPSFNRDEVFVSLAAADLQGTFVPTDIKKVDAQKTQSLNILPSQDSYLVSALLKSNEFGNGNASPRMSASLKKFNDGMTPVLLPMVANPTVANNGGAVQLPEVKGPASVLPTATVMVLSLVQQVKSGDNNVEVLDRQWEVYANGWQTQVNMPQWPNDAKLNGKKRWEVNFIGTESESQPMQAPSQFGMTLVNSATHVTRSAVDFN